MMDATNSLCPLKTQYDLKPLTSKVTNLIPLREVKTIWSIIWGITFYSEGYFIWFYIIRIARKFFITFLGEGFN